MLLLLSISASIIIDAAFLERRMCVKLISLKKKQAMKTRLNECKVETIMKPWVQYGMFLNEEWKHICIYSYLETILL